MEGWKVELFSRRELRAMVLVPVAAVALLVAALAWVHPGGGARHVTAAAPRPSPIAPSVQAWYFASPRLGWVVLAGGSFEPRPLGLYRTSDGGRSWKKLPVDLGSGFVSHLDFFDQRHGYLFLGGSEPALLMTADAGDHWRPVATPPVADGTGFVFISPSTGWAVSPGSRLSRTLDGGRSWTPLAASGLPKGGATQFEFADADRGWVATPDIYVTGDGGASWRPGPSGITLPTGGPGPAQPLVSVSAAPPAYALALAYAVRTSSQTTVLDSYGLYLTPDAGITWRGPIALPEAGSVQNVDLLDAGRWWLVQNQGSLWRSTDGGRHWTGLRGAVAGGLELAAVRFFDEGSGVGVAVEPGTRSRRSLVATTDGGANWRSVSLPAS